MPRMRVSVATSQLKSLHHRLEVLYQGHIRIVNALLCFKHDYMWTLCNDFKTACGRLQYMTSYMR
eukprot:11671-Heterococcus_DN1.PRE.3